MNHDVVALGLPSSGKTTYLAALWHLVTANEVDCALTLVSLKAGEAVHLHALAERWLRAQEQDRTRHSGNRTVTISLRAGDASEFQLSFPDVAGESFQLMWESRECDESVASLLRSAGVMLFVHADTIKNPGWIVDDAKEYAALGLPVEEGVPVPWHPRVAPTQVQLVDLLQSLQTQPLDVGPRRLAVILSAWDTAMGEGLSPQDYLCRHLPLLDQYLNHGLDDGWEVHIYGVSAQGGKYDEVDAALGEDAERMRAMDVPSHRILVVDGKTTAHDLTTPIHWLLS